MMPLIDEWVELAEDDYSSALLLLRSRKSPNYRASRFHAQQCAEKYLKALLQRSDIAFPKTHDLVKLATLLSGVDSQWMLFLPQLRDLTGAAVEVRYPGVPSNKEDAREAVLFAGKIRELARLSLNLKSNEIKAKKIAGRRKRR